jgi:hypothetical protein
MKEISICICDIVLLEQHALSLLLWIKSILYIYIFFFYYTKSTTEPKGQGSQQPRKIRYQKKIGEPIWVRPRPKAAPTKYQHFFKI